MQGVFTGKFHFCKEIEARRGVIKRRKKGGDLEFLNKTVRVVSECANEGRVGLVRKIHRELAEYKCQVLTDGGVFNEKLEKLELDVPSRVPSSSTSGGCRNQSERASSTSSRAQAGTLSSSCMASSSSNRQW